MTQTVMQTVFFCIFLVFASLIFCFGKLLVLNASRSSANFFIVIASIRCLPFCKSRIDVPLKSGSTCWISIGRRTEKKRIQMKWNKRICEAWHQHQCGRAANLWQAIRRRWGKLHAKLMAGVCCNCTDGLGNERVKCQLNVMESIFLRITNSENKSLAHKWPRVFSEWIIDRRAVRVNNAKHEQKESIAPQPSFAIVKPQIFRTNSKLSTRIFFCWNRHTPHTKSLFVFNFSDSGHF